MIYKTYKSIRWLINILFTVVTTVFASVFDFLGVNDFIRNIFDWVQSFTYKLGYAKHVEQIKDIAVTTKSKVASKIIESDIPVVSESLREKYKTS
jgi:hypothetical protein